MKRTLSIIGTTIAVLVILASMAYWGMKWKAGVDDTLTLSAQATNESIATLETVKITLETEQQKVVRLKAQLRKVEHENEKLKSLMDTQIPPQVVCESLNGGIWISDGSIFDGLCKTE